MVTIRQEQYGSLQESALSSYREQLLVHFQTFAPELFSIVGEEQFRVFVDDGMNKALGIGLNLRGPMRMLIEIMCIVGQDVETDPQYRPMWPEGDPREIPMPFAQRLRIGFGNYLDKCVGANKEILIASLRRLLSAPLEPGSPFRDWTHDYLAKIYPQKLEYMGEKNFSDFLDACEGPAKLARVESPHGRLLVVILAGSFGVNFLSNPLYPWVAKRMLADAPEERRLAKTETALRTYASKMLANLEKEEA